MSKQRKCSKCGQAGHRVETCGRESTYRKTKGKPKSWVKKLEKKLEAVAESDEGSPKPSERSGEPFADLPPLDLPNTAASESSTGEPSSQPSETATVNDASTQGAATTTSESKTTGSTEKKVFDTETLQKMAYGIGVGWMKLTSEIAMKGGHMAIGEDMWPIVGMACSVIVKKNAEKFDIDDETGALYVVCGMGGFNGVQAGRTLWDEHKAKKEAQSHARATVVGKAEQQRQQNGVTPAAVADLRKQQSEHVAEQRTAGPVV